VIDRREGEVGPMNRSSRDLERFERLGRGHLVDQVEIYEEQVGTVGIGPDDVIVPDSLEKRMWR